MFLLLHSNGKTYCLTVVLIYLSHLSLNLKCNIIPFYKWVKPGTGTGSCLRTLSMPPLLGLIMDLTAEVSCGSFDSLFDFMYCRPTCLQMSITLWWEPLKGLIKQLVLSILQLPVPIRKISSSGGVERIQVWYWGLKAWLY